MKTTPLYQLHSLDQWHILSLNENNFHLEAVIPLEKAGRYTLLYLLLGSRRSDGYPFPEKVTLNGKELDMVREADFAYCVSGRLQSSVEVECIAGDNLLSVSGSGYAPDMANFLKFDLIPCMEKEEKVPPFRKLFDAGKADFSDFEEIPDMEKPDLSAYREGCGTAPAPGPFCFPEGRRSSGLCHAGPGTGG